MNARVMGAILAATVALAGCKTAAEQKPSAAVNPPAANAPAVSAPAPATTLHSLLSEGTAAPEITGVAHNGEAVKLSAFRGRPVVVYFYPKDDTPGCTAEAEGVRDDWEQFKSANIAVIGVSTDDIDSHRAFADKYKLPFLLLPDPDQRIASAFGVPVTGGKAKRTTFVIDKNGQIAKVFPDVNPRGHSAELLSAARSLGS